MDIQETEWRTPVNQLMEYKHFYAVKGSKCFIAVASRGISHNAIPTTRGATYEMEISNVEDDSEGARNKVLEWILTN